MAKRANRLETTDLVFSWYVSPDFEIYEIPIFPNGRYSAEFLSASDTVPYLKRPNYRVAKRNVKIWLLTVVKLLLFYFLIQYIGYCDNNVYGSQFRENGLPDKTINYFRSLEN